MSYAAEVLADNPSLFLELDELTGTTLNDSSSFAFSGTYNGTPTLGVASLITAGTAVSFHGSGSDGGGVISLAARSEFNNNTGQLSVEAWVKSSASSAASPQLVCADDAGQARYFQFRIEASGALGFIVLTSLAGVHSVAGSVTINDGRTHHCVGTFDGSVMLVYVDGVVDGPGTSGAFTPNPSSPGIFVAKRRSSSVDSALLNGVLDDAAYYKSALSASRIAAHYQAGIQAQRAQVLVPRSVSSAAPKLRLRCGP